MKATALLLALSVPVMVAAPVAAAAAPAPAVPAGILVYYFHGTTRCATCKTIEAYAHETVATAFAAELKAGSLEWKLVNVDEPASQHFVRDYQLYTRSVVVVDAKDPKRFKVLDRVWQLVGDKAAFQKYVEQEIRAFPRS
ncbi:MAG TPA: nitrophenyl compound nitroreductase subunit ArsF family protein [Vicinamibacteria bacterium]|jgi:hypothetical protein|nr:nitrophenyl compound nitroreductase subunit ArsF family protein [Vicinamibacteria bacterium]